MRRRLVALAATLLGVAAGVVLPASSAHAAACPDASGVTVVVENAALGGGTSVDCVAAGGTATALFARAGRTLEYVQRQPGFVCRVSGRPAPAADPCVNTPPTDRYWGLFWSDGTSGTWTYATLGAGSLTVPAGGFVAFAWQSGSGRNLPDVAPVRAAARPTTPAPTRTPAAGGGRTDGERRADGPAASAPRSPDGGTSAAPQAGRPSAGATGSATPAGPTPATPRPSDAASAGTPAPAVGSAPAADAEPALEAVSGEPEQDGSGALPWVAGGLVLALLAGTAGVVLRRRTGA